MAADTSTSNNSLSRGQMVDALRGCINSGEFADVFPLPSERVLGDRFSSHRTTVRRALKQLIDEGVLRREGRRVMVSRRTKGWMSGTVALVVPPPATAHDPHVWRRWSEYTTFNLSRVIGDEGLNLLTLHPSQLTADLLERLHQMRPLGVLVPEVFGLNTAAVNELCEAVVGHDVRIVVGGGDPSLGCFDRVVSDHEHGGYILAKALLDEGRTRITNLFACELDLYWATNRLAGTRRACEEAGVDVPATISVPSVGPIYNREHFEQRVKVLAGSLLAEFGPNLETDAILTASDRGCFAAAAAVRMFGKEPGRDVVICGYDNVFELCEESQFEPMMPHLTVDKHNNAMGLRMLDMLRARVDETTPAEPQAWTVKPTLIRPKEFGKPLSPS